MEFYSVSGNDTDTSSGASAGAQAVAVVTDLGVVSVQLTDEQFDALVGQSSFSGMSLDGQIGLFTGSIAIGFSLASLVLVIKLAFGAIKKLLQRI